MLDYKRLYGEIESKRPMQIGSSERVIPDIILKKDKQDVFDIELKQYNLSFSDKFETQLISYLNQLHISAGMIVCKKIYLYSYDYSSNTSKRLAISFEKDNEDGIRLIELLSKDNLDKNEIEKFIVDKDKKAKNIKEIEDNLDSELIIKLLKEHYQQNYTNAEISEALSNVYITVSHNRPTFSENKTLAIPEQTTKPKNDNVISKFIEIADKWCREKSKQGLINYNKDNNSAEIVRFGTKNMDSYLPADDNRNINWKNRDYFYEIDFRKNKMKISIAFKNRHNDKEEKINKILLTENRTIDNPNWDWRICWSSNSIKQVELTSEEVILNYLDKQFESVMSKENKFFE